MVVAEVHLRIEGFRRPGFTGREMEAPEAEKIVIGLHENVIGRIVVKDNRKIIALARRGDGVVPNDGTVFKLAAYADEYRRQKNQGKAPSPYRLKPILIV